MLWIGIDKLAVIVNRLKIAVLLFLADLGNHEHGIAGAGAVGILGDQAIKNLQGFAGIAQLLIMQQTLFVQNIGQQRADRKEHFELEVDDVGNLMFSGIPVHLGGAQHDFRHPGITREKTDELPGILQGIWIEIVIMDADQQIQVAKEIVRPAAVKGDGGDVLVEPTAFFGVFFLGGDHPPQCGGGFVAGRVLREEVERLEIGGDRLAFPAFLFMNFPQHAQQPGAVGAVGKGYQVVIDVADQIIPQVFFVAGKGFFQKLVGALRRVLRTRRIRHAKK